MNSDFLKRLFSAALFAAVLAGCGGTDTSDDEGIEPQLETTQQSIGFIMNCNTAEFIYNAVCDRYGNWSSQCTSAYDQLHCFCQNCSPAVM